MGILKADDIVKHGDVQKAFEARRKEAAKHLKETGSLPKDWELRIAPNVHRGAPPKFVSPDEYLSKGLEYFENCEAEGALPTKSGLCLHMGFTSWYVFNDYARKWPNFRPAHGTLLLLLQEPYEKIIAAPGATAGKKFVLTNINEGFDVEDSAEAPLRYSWKEKQQTELVGADGGPVTIKRDMSPEEAYLMMLEGGKLEDEKSSDLEGVPE